MNAATQMQNLENLDGMTALINGEDKIYLCYQAQWTEVCRVATKQEFMDNYDRDFLLGIDGNALDEDNEIICADGKISASEIL